MADWQGSVKTTRDSNPPQAPPRRGPPGSGFKRPQNAGSRISRTYSGSSGLRRETESQRQQNMVPRKPPLPPPAYSDRNDASVEGTSKQSKEHTDLLQDSRTRSKSDFDREGVNGGLPLIVHNYEQIQSTTTDTNETTTRDDYEGGEGDEQEKILLSRRILEMTEQFSDFPEPEDVLQNFTCNLGSNAFSQGRIFITQTALVYVSRFLGHWKKIEIQVSQITGVEKKNTAMFIRDSIDIYTKEKRYSFQSFFHREQAYSLITRIWKEHQEIGSSSPSQKNVTRDLSYLLPGEKVIQEFPTVIWITQNGGQRPGDIIFTNRAIVFLPRLRGGGDDAITSIVMGSRFSAIPLPSIFKVRKIEGSIGTRMSSQLMRLGVDSLSSSVNARSLREVEILTKDFREIKIGFHQDGGARNQFFEKVSKGLKFKPLNAFAFTFSESSTPCSVFDIISEYHRFHIPSLWRRSRVNESYSLCPSYPSILYLPSAISDEKLGKIAQFRRKGRIPVLTWYSRKTKASISRCAQPASGLARQRRSSEDEDLIAEIGNVAKELGAPGDVYIFDARPFTNALANAAKGAGYEDSSFYPNTKLVFCGIQNIHVMRKAHSSLFDLVTETSPILGGSKYWTSVGPWMEHIHSLLLAAEDIVNKLAVGHSIVIHCSDGWDRTSQLSALSQLCMDPYFRCVHGYSVLIEKEFLSFGYKSHQRLGLTPGKDDERSPVLLQFVDCTFQLLVQYPCSFEFTESFLVDFLTLLYSGDYGNFLFDCEFERVSSNSSRRTRSIWSELLKTDYTNPLYALRDRKKDILMPSTSPHDIRLFSKFYLRHNPSFLEGEIEDEIDDETSAEESGNVKISSIYGDMQIPSQLLAVIDSLFAIKK